MLIAGRALNSLCAEHARYESTPTKSNLCRMKAELVVRKKKSQTLSKSLFVANTFISLNMTYELKNKVTNSHKHLFYSYVVCHMSG